MTTPNQNTETALTIAPPQEVAVVENPVVTAQQARVQSVASALDEAYKNASKLTLTPEEAKALAADFPDEAFRLGAGGDPNLIYIEHAYLRQRLNEVLGVGAAVPIRRREWAEEFTYFKDGKNKIGVRVYVDLALLVKGCLVGEAIGDAIYYPDNAKTNYSDALESAKSNAFRRCAKEFGVGLQAWMKGWGEGWKERQRHPKPRSYDHGDVTRASEAPEPPSYRTQPNKTPENTVSAPKRASSDAPKMATPTRRNGVLDFLRQHFDESELMAFASDRKFVADGSTALEDWSLEKIPVSNAQLNDLKAEISKWLDPEAPPDMPPNGEEPELPAEIAKIPFHIPPAGTRLKDYKVQTIGELYEQRHDPEVARRLFGMASHFEPSGYKKADGTQVPPSKEDFALREGLDRLNEWIEAHKQPEFDIIP